MVIIKNNYYLYIENTYSVNFNTIKKNQKFSIIYRNNGAEENFNKLNNLRKQCNTKGYKFYVANNFRLAVKCKADGLYLSSYNKKKYFKQNIKYIGAAHNSKEIFEKQKQGCTTIILSRLFRTNYNNKKSFFGTTKFNLIVKEYRSNILPLGGINSLNLLKLNLVSADGFALLSEIKKKPAISSRLF